MALKKYKGLEVVAAVIPPARGHTAAIPVKPRSGGGAARFLARMPHQRSKTADDADLAAVQELQRLVDIDAEGEPVWADA
ncbi:hypothetical protein B1F69_10370 [Pseudomonas syringae]|uniref:hypothetical protein n=1 Tax=Pseudomonas syringae TaxID=317 RepID=UPI0010108273|nr:hypothetical protein [Pseudomonas syringae]RXT94986.1 hypothetical protein B1F69_10370 [Pseudomonas syringae]